MVRLLAVGPTTPSARRRHLVHHFTRDRALDDQEVAINLATQAAQRRNWSKSEHYARKALQKQEDWTEAKIALAIALFEDTIAKRGNTRFGRLDDEAQARVSESAELLSSAVQHLPAYRDPAYKAALLVNLAGTYQLLGRDTEADDLIVSARSLAPTAVDIQFAYASYLIDRRQLDHAVSMLQGQEATSPKADLVLAQALALRNQGSDQRDAIDLLSLSGQRIQLLEKQPPELRTEWLRTLLRLHMGRDETHAAAEVLASQTATWLRQDELLIWNAHVALASDDTV
jgi:tetratricopeptide (TPR) repeat protein